MDFSDSFRPGPCMREDSLPGGTMTMKLPRQIQARSAKRKNVAGNMGDLLGLCPVCNALLCKVHPNKATAASVHPPPAITRRQSFGHPGRLSHSLSVCPRCARMHDRTVSRLHHQHRNLKPSGSINAIPYRARLSKGIHHLIQD